MHNRDEGRAVQDAARCDKPITRWAAPREVALAGGWVTRGAVNGGTGALSDRSINDSYPLQSTLQRCLLTYLCLRILYCADFARVVAAHCNARNSTDTG